MTEQNTLQHKKTFTTPAEKDRFDTSTSTASELAVFDPSKTAYDYGERNPDGFVAAATSIAVTPATKTLAVAATQQLTVTVSPVGADDDVIYSSSDVSKATVSATGLVTGVATGTATITVRARVGGATATSAITVGS